MAPNANPELRPEQERVRNLLSDTVTLLCKNGLTYKARLRIEGLLGVSIDDREVFFVHISETFSNAPPEDEPPIENPSESTEGTATDDQRSNADQTKNPDEQSSTEDIKLKLEPPAEEDDDLLIVEPPPEDLAQFNQNFSPMAGHRRSYTSQERDTGAYGWGEMGEPPRKRRTDHSGYQTSGYDTAEQAGGSNWPSFSGDDLQNSQICQMDPNGGNNFNSNTPGCSSWPVQSPSQTQAQEQTGQRRHPADSRKSMVHLKRPLFENLVTPLLQENHQFVAFRLCWSNKDLSDCEDQVWKNMPNFQQYFAEQLQSMTGMLFFISAVSATESVRKGCRSVNPVIGFWAVMDPALAHSCTVLSRMRNNPYGAALKLLPGNGNEPDIALDHVCSILKDWGPNFVQNKLNTFADAKGFLKERIYMKAETNHNYSEVLVNVQGILSQHGLTLNLETY